MDPSTTDHYDRVLDHVGRPQDPAERRPTPSTTLQDFEALWLAKNLRGLADYHVDGTDETIARGLAEYVDGVVRDEGEPFVTIYVKTDKARDVIDKAMLMAPDSDVAIGTLVETATDVLHDESDLSDGDN
jgi:hypothetical protein